MANAYNNVYIILYKDTSGAWSVYANSGTPYTYTVAQDAVDAAKALYANNNYKIYQEIQVTVTDTAVVA
jgi:hypothetical protein